MVDGVQLYCQYRELENGAAHLDVHVPRKNRPAHEDMHWILEG